MGQHKWSNSWPGNICLRCGSDDPLENALAVGWYDPFTQTFDTEAHRLEVERAFGNCPFADIELPLEEPK